MLDRCVLSVFIISQKALKSVEAISQTNHQRNYTKIKKNQMPKAEKTETKAPKRVVKAAAKEEKKTAKSKKATAQSK